MKFTGRILKDKKDNYGKYEYKVNDIVTVRSWSNSGFLKGYVSVEFANGKRDDIPFADIQIFNKFGHKVKPETTPFPYKRVRKRGYVLLTRRENGSIAAMTEHSFSMSWSDEETDPDWIQTACVWWDWYDSSKKKMISGAPTHYLKKVQNGDGFDKDPNVFIARIHSKECPIDVHIDQYTGKGNYRFTVKGM